MTQQSSPQYPEAESAQSPAEAHDAGTAPEQEGPPEQAAPLEEAAPEDLGENAHDVVVSLLHHQQDLMVELRTAYDRLDEVREVEFRQLETRVQSAVGELREVPGRLAAMRSDLESTAHRVDEHGNLCSEKVEELSASAADLRARLETRERQVDELASIAAQLQSRLEEVAAESAEAHRRLEVLAQETNSSLLSTLPGRARTAAHKVSRRFKR
ncbi:hypothetical protein [Nesterenkonia populi]|uniref:hypothetical protein n=1 Tax=Nesterenkonia populi TaxID=1591087 RepID=UPI0011BF4958|nr:hypothetical protein [Nesterenkonia populi]